MTWLSTYKIQSHLQITLLVVINEFSNVARLACKHWPHLYMPAMNIGKKHLKDNVDFQFPVWHVRSWNRPLFVLKQVQRWAYWKPISRLRPVREVRSQGKLWPPKLQRPRGKYRESQLTGVETHKHKPGGNQW